MSKFPHFKAPCINVYLLTAFYQKQTNKQNVHQTVASVESTLLVRFAQFRKMFRLLLNTNPPKNLKLFWFKRQYIWVWRQDLIIKVALLSNMCMQLQASHPRWDQLLTSVQKRLRPSQLWCTSRLFRKQIFVFYRPCCFQRKLNPQPWRRRVMKTTYWGNLEPYSQEKKGQKREKK